MTPGSLALARMACPCCGYATLPARTAYKVCRLCNWQDDGQGDADADEVRHGPNAHYSLSKARANFKRYRVMYAPGPDSRVRGAGSRLEFETKGRLMAALEHLQRCSQAHVEPTLVEIAELEHTLYEEALRRVLEYDAARVAARRDAAPARRWMRSLGKLIAALDPR